MNKRSLFWGVFFILSAVLVILNQLDILIGVSLVSLIVSLLMIPIIIKSLKHRSFAGVLFPLALVAIMFDSQLGIEKLTPWPILGVALFLSIGLSFIFPMTKKWQHHKFSSEYISTDDEIFDAEEGNVVNVESRFSGATKYIKSTNLKRVNIDCHFSGVEVYLDSAQIDGDVLIVNMDVSYSGVELFIPVTWKVENQTDCMLAAVDEGSKRRHQLVDKEKRVILQGKIKLAGVDIKYV